MKIGKSRFRDTRQGMKQQIECCADFSHAVKCLKLSLCLRHLYAWKMIRLIHENQWGVHLQWLSGWFYSRFKSAAFAEPRCGRPLTSKYLAWFLFTTFTWHWNPCMMAKLKEERLHKVWLFTHQPSSNESKGAPASRPCLYRVNRLQMPLAVSDLW